MLQAAEACSYQSYLQVHLLKAIQLSAVQARNQGWYLPYIVVIDQI